MMMKVCPLFYTPYRNCYCVDMNSSTLRDALHYCGGEFDRCEIYIRHSLTSTLGKRVTKEATKC